LIFIIFLISTRSINAHLNAHTLYTHTHTHPKNSENISWITYYNTRQTEYSKIEIQTLSYWSRVRDSSTVLHDPLPSPSLIIFYESWNKKGALLSIWSQMGTGEWLQKSRSPNFFTTLTSLQMSRKHNKVWLGVYKYI
jgi:hypothetical protein